MGTSAPPWHHGRRHARTASRLHCQAPDSFPRALRSRTRPALRTTAGRLKPQLDHGTPLTPPGPSVWGAPALPGSARRAPLPRARCPRAPSPDSSAGCRAPPASARRPLSRGATARRRGTPHGTLPPGATPGGRSPTSAGGPPRPFAPRSLEGFREEGARGFLPVPARTSQAGSPLHCRWADLPRAPVRPCSSPQPLPSRPFAPGCSPPLHAPPQPPGVRRAPQRRPGASQEGSGLKARAASGLAELCAPGQSPRFGGPQAANWLRTVRWPSGGVAGAPQGAWPWAAPPPRWLPGVRAALWLVIGPGSQPPRLGRCPSCARHLSPPGAPRLRGRRVPAGRRQSGHRWVLRGSGHGRSRGRARSARWALRAARPSALRGGLEGSGLQTGDGEPRAETRRTDGLKGWGEDVRGQERGPEGGARGRRGSGDSRVARMAVPLPGNEGARRGGCWVSFGHAYRSCMLPAVTRPL